MRRFTRGFRGPRDCKANASQFGSDCGSSDWIDGGSGGGGEVMFVWACEKSDVKVFVGGGVVGQRNAWRECGASTRMCAGAIS